MTAAPTPKQQGEMMRRKAGLIVALLTSALSPQIGHAQRVDATDFKSPPPAYRPTFTISEGAGESQPSLQSGAQHAFTDLGAGGILFSPDGDPARHKPGNAAAIAKLRVGLLDRYPTTTTPWVPKALPGEAMFGSYLADAGGKAPARKSLGFMTPQWFEAARQALDVTRRHGGYATYYDEVGFPSGNADGTIPARFYRKLLRRSETTVSAGQPFVLDWTGAEKPVAVVAWDPTSGERIDLLAKATGNRITWTAALGGWRVQSFYVSSAAASAFSPDYYGSADYLDPEATRWFIAHSYDAAYKELRPYFGSVIKYTFFDDVGYFPDEKTWGGAVADRFEKITGKSPALYYPALWDDIGPDTAAARIAFFRARAEILGETFPKLIADWARGHGVKATGHAPGNYDLQPTEMYGDPFKFYAYTDVPMVDVLWGLGFARNGFKLVSSVSEQRDLPETAAEAFSVDNDAIGYKRTIELFVRGVNHFVFGGRQPSKPRGTPAQLADWAGRSSYLLQGGRHVADIAVVFPIESLQAFYSFDARNHSPEEPRGVYAYRDADYQAVGEMLLSGLHRDFTFVHPEALAGDKLRVNGRTLDMQNRVNREQFRVLLLPGGDVLSLAALEKIKAFWDAGGTVIATSLLPSRSAEFGKDEDVRRLVAAMFGTGPAVADGSIHRNGAGGQALFVPRPSTEALGTALDLLKMAPDVAFEGNPAPTSGNGVFGYTHRVRDGKDIYYFGNSSDTPVNTLVTLRGRIAHPQYWNPHDGSVRVVRDVRYRNGPQGVLTEFPLSVPAVSSIAVVGGHRE